MRRNFELVFRLEVELAEIPTKAPIERAQATLDDFGRFGPSGGRTSVEDGGARNHCSICGRAGFNRRTHVGPGQAHSTGPTSTSIVV
jgi:hypothetical protein